MAWPRLGGRRWGGLWCGGLWWGLVAACGAFQKLSRWVPWKQAAKRVTQQGIQDLCSLEVSSLCPSVPTTQSVLPGNRAGVWCSVIRLFWPGWPFPS